MYTLVRRFIKTAVLFLILGLAIGTWIIARREFALEYPSTYIVSAHTHALLVGFMIMMILGVALWMFPRPDKSDKRYSPLFAESSYWLLTIGTAGRVVGELLRTQSHDLWLRSAIVIFSILQVVAIVLYFYTMWSRIRPTGSHLREARGERF